MKGNFLRCIFVRGKNSRADNFGVEKLQRKRNGEIVFCSFFKVALREDSPLREKYFILLVIDIFYAVS